MATIIEVVYRTVSQNVVKRNDQIAVGRFSLYKNIVKISYHVSLLEQLDATASVLR